MIFLFLRPYRKSAHWLINGMYIAVDGASRSSAIHGRLRVQDEASEEGFEIMTEGIRHATLGFAKYVLW